MSVSGSDVLLEIRGLKTFFFTDEGVVKAVNGVDLTLRQGETLCLVGESGCGKSITARSILQLIDRPGRIVEGAISFCRKDGRVVDVARMKPTGREVRDIRGNEISMIFQEPMSSLSPVHTIGDQLSETLQIHLGLDKEQVRARVVEMLERVGIPRASEQLASYPFELSGGMRQRAMIAMALLCRSSLLIADEPTTALDVTTQANILDLIKELQRDLGMSVMFITHDLGVVAEIADTVAVMYLGQVVESGPAESIYHDPKHPYLQALLRSIPKLDWGGERLDSIEGMVPHPFRRPEGCAFHTRCRQRIAGTCDTIEPASVTLQMGRPLQVGRHVKCHLYAGAKAEVSR